MLSTTLIVLFVALYFAIEPKTYVTLLYLGVQMIGNCLTTPLLEKRVLYLPHGYIVAAQLLFDCWAIWSGVVAALVTIVRILYVEAVLEDQVQSGDKHER